MSYFPQSFSLLHFHFKLMQKFKNSLSLLLGGRFHSVASKEKKLVQQNVKSKKRHMKRVFCYGAITLNRESGVTYGRQQTPHFNILNVQQLERSKAHIYIIKNITTLSFASKFLHKIIARIETHSNYVARRLPIHH